MNRTGNPAQMPTRQLETRGLLYGLVGVVVFSLTLPASRVAVGWFGTIVVGPGRALVAAVFAASMLWLKHEKLPDKRYLPGLIIIVIGAIFGFPLLTAWAMDRVPASHGAVELALLPLATAAVSALRHGERPSWKFWGCSGGGALTVAVYSGLSGFGGFRFVDLALLGAVVIVAFAYAEGGRMSSDLGGWQVIAWSVVLAAPAVVIVLALDLVFGGMAHIHASWMAWAGLVYLGAGSQFFGFVAWYTGMALGGVARVSQLQYLQPFFTILFSWLLLGEPLTIPTVLAAMVVVLWVALGRWTSIRAKSGNEQTDAVVHPYTDEA
ncbi:hypothetical protein GCM10025857_13080 [Alicyclobacillus contaminans]|uniref:DMT family transporter n=1 Tax=Alicyclobacillus contaminans TaxID=392016 RepID=UPI00041FA839|nr:DMT family transporter [Alicyclobacillus contaminans]GMA49951.1 hypothetical protein GCM10025857_13080 [Alicyclobacillus contaminans]